ncbi:MAG: metalloregulator ArsR/SmtB family transcription factor, partial [Gorillibacterium sp.]|nr:metalloregulator ArsR/SmtB family transcription factor [Gorillibacterium sp.]
AEHFDMQKPSVSHHLKILKQADLVEDRRVGQHIYYSLNTTAFQNLLKWVVELQNRKNKEI